MERLKARFWQQAIFFRLLLPLCTGIVIGQYYYSATLSLVSALLTLCCSLVLLLLRKSDYIQLQAVLALLALTTSGVWIHSRDQQIPDARIPRAVPGTYYVYVSNILPARPGFQKIELQIIGADSQQFRSTKALLWVKGEQPRINIGDSMLVYCSWRSIENSGIPGDFDRKRHAAMKQLYLQGYCRSDQLRLTGHRAGANKGLLSSMSASAAAIIDKQIGEPKTRALLKAMLLGDERDIDSDIRQAYSDTGIVHIISISGAHVALLFTLIQALLFWIGRKHRQFYLFVVSGVTICLYVCMAGAPSSAVRAAAMFLLLQLGVVSGQRHNPLNQLFAAAFLMLLFRPLWLFNIGFQLSFTAVASLIIFYRPLLKLCPTRSLAATALRNAIAASIAAEILVAPLVAYYFHSFPLLFLPANLIAAAGMTLIEAMGLALLLLHQFSGLSMAMASAITFCSEAFHYLIFLLQKATIPALQRIYLSMPALTACYLTITALTLFLSTKSKRIGFLVLIGLSSFSVFHCIHVWRRAKQQIMIVWWQHQVPNGLVVQRGQSSGIGNFACDEHSITNLLVVSGARYPGGAGRNAFLISDQKVVVVDTSVQPRTKLVADIVLLQLPSPYAPPEQYLPFLKTKIVVMATYLSQRRLQEWRMRCKEATIRLHYLPADGPFVIKGKD